MKHMIIFLDVDGVLNNEESHSRFYSEFVDNLNLLTNSCEAKIVLTSTIRNNPILVKKLQSLLHSSIIDVTPDFGRYFCDFTTQRAAEIAFWIENNRHIIDKYVVLDDEELPLQHFYHIENGLTKRDSQLLKIILDCKDIANS